MTTNHDIVIYILDSFKQRPRSSPAPPGLGPRHLLPQTACCSPWCDRGGGYASKPIATPVRRQLFRKGSSATVVLGGSRESLDSDEQLAIMNRATTADKLSPKATPKAKSPKVDTPASRTLSIHKTIGKTKASPKAKVRNWKIKSSPGVLPTQQAAPSAPAAPSTSGGKQNSPSLRTKKFLEQSRLKRLAAKESAEKSAASTKAAEKAAASKNAAKKGDTAEKAAASKSDAKKGDTAEKAAASKSDAKKGDIAEKADASKKKGNASAAEKAAASKSAAKKGDIAEKADAPKSAKKGNASAAEKAAASKSAAKSKPKKPCASKDAGNKAAEKDTKKPNKRPSAKEPEEPAPASKDKADHEREAKASKPVDGDASDLEDEETRVKRAKKAHAMYMKYWRSLQSF